MTAPLRFRRHVLIVPSDHALDRMRDAVADGMAVIEERHGGWPPAGSADGRLMQLLADVEGLLIEARPETSRREAARSPRRAPSRPDGPIPRREAACSREGRCDEAE